MADRAAGRKRVVIVGGGFAGLNAAKILGRSADVDVTLIDRRNYHLFQPLLYQVAMAGLSPADIATPIRALLSQYGNTEIVLGNVDRVDLQERKVAISEGQSFSYDYLILACGAKHSYFGHNEWEEAAPGLKTLEQATEIRRRVLLAFELAERETDVELQKQLLTFVVVGGGPTGVELAGALGEISRYTLGKDFRHIDPRRTRVILIEAGPRILAGFDASLAAQAARDLENLGVQVWTSSRVTEVSAKGVRLGNEAILASTVVWAAGVQPSSLSKTLNVPLDRAGRVVVESDLSLKGFPEVFVLGDQAHAKDESGNPLPGLAPVAMQQGRTTAQNILREIKGEAREVFRYKDKGVMATIGRKKAIAQYRGMKLTGFMAWVGWLLVHIYFLIGFRNRLFVLMSWTWSYFTFKRGARLIVSKEWRSTPEAKELQDDTATTAVREGAKTIY